MKKFLKRTLAVMLVVCLLASVVPAVSAIPVQGNVTETKNYAFNKTAGYPGTITGNTVYTSTDESSAFRSSRGLAGHSDYIYHNSFGSNSLVIQLNNIGTSVDGKYTLSFDVAKSSTAVLKIYLLDSSYTFGGSTASKTEIGTLSAASGGVTTTTTLSNVELNDYLNNGSVHIMFYGNSGGTALYFAGAHVSYQVAGDTVEVPAATLEQTYDFNPYGANAHQVNAFSDGSKNFGFTATNDRYNDGELNWAPVAEKREASKSGYYSWYNNNGTGGSLQIRTYYQDWTALKIKAPSVSGEYSMKLNAYTSTDSTRKAQVYIMEYTSALADQANIAEAISTDTYLQKTIMTLRASNNNVTVDLGSYEFETGKEYLIVFYAAQTNSTDYPTDLNRQSYMYLRELVLTGAPLEIDDANFSKFDKVTLAWNHTGDLNVGAGQIDLNGYTVSGDITSATGEGIVTDSKTSKAYLPLGNGTDYKYFTYTTTTTFSGTNPYKDGNAAYFWFDINFDDETAYDLIAAGESGLAISAELVLVTAGIEATVEFDTTVTDWAAAQAESTEDIAMGVKVRGLSTIEGPERIGMLFKYSAGNTSGIIGNGLELRCE